MALLIRGKTSCAICGRIIGETDDAILFPHFVLNEGDPLHFVSDGSCHSSCVRDHPSGISMLAALDEFAKKVGPGRRACAVCRQEIDNPSDYFMIGYLADPSVDPIGIFNYTHLHKSHIRDWKLAGEFISLAEAAINSARWQGQELPNIIREISKFSDM